MLVVESVDEQDGIIDNMEPGVSDEEDHSLPGPWVSLYCATHKPPQLLSG